MSDNIRGHFQAEVVDGEAGRCLRLFNDLNDEVVVDFVGDPRVRAFALESVILDNRYFDLDWDQRAAWAADETALCLAELHQQYAPHDDIVSSHVLESQRAPEYSSMPGNHDVSHEHFALGLSHEYLPESPDYQVSYDQGMSGPSSEYAVMHDGRLPTPPEALDGQYPGPHADTASMDMSAPASALTDEMEVDQPSGPRGTAKPKKRTAAKAQVDTYPFAKELKYKFPESEWEFLFRICIEHFLNDLREVEAKGGGLKWIKNGTDTMRSKDHKRKKQLMAMTLLDPRVISSDTDYTVTERQFDGQLFERMLVGWSQRTIEHTRMALATDCFEKPLVRKERRIDPNTGKTKKSTRNAGDA